MSNRRTFVRFSFFILFAIIGLSFSMLGYAKEAQAATLKIDQTNPSKRETLGSWTLIQPDNTRIIGSGATITVTTLKAGRYTLIATPPDGASVSIRTFIDGEDQGLLKRPQITFELLDTMEMKLSIFHTLTRVGKVSVQSDPHGIQFTIRGPNGMLEDGTTPTSYDDVAEGQYSVQYHALEGCVTPAPRTQLLLPDGRATFQLDVDCKAATVLRKRQQEQNEEILTVGSGDNAVLLRDIPKDAWFSSYVFNAARRNILSGYKDEDGNATGLFGPENNVTIGELAKIAHKVGTISAESFEDTIPKNENARGHWFSSFIASAENRAWTIFSDANVHPLRAATRAEVVITLLQVLDIPLEWQTGQMFTDVHVHTPYAAAIETAAKQGFIEGRSDEDGNPLHLFDPEAPVNRAELSKIVDVILSKNDEQ